MRRFHVTTFGCQMNVHDSERIKGMLEAAGMGEATSGEEADVLVFNTCTIREKADDRLVQHLHNAKNRKATEPGLQIIVAGCWAESTREAIFRDFPWVDAAVGPGRIGALQQVLTASPGAERGAFGSFDDFAADLPKRRERSFQAWLQLSMGCNSVCSYCIVPSVRGRERSRHPREVLAEARSLAADGVSEVMLLGQNVNSYGRDLPPDERCTFAEMLRAVDAIDGISRIRFMSPHPKDMRGDVIAAMAESPAVCNQLHLPLQSGSSRVLKRMRRTYDSERFLDLVVRLREAMPDISLTTDVIVGFPGETEEDFQETLRVYDEASFDHAFTTPLVATPRSSARCRRSSRRGPAAPIRWSSAARPAATRPPSSRPQRPLARRCRSASRRRRRRRCAAASRAQFRSDHDHARRRDLRPHGLRQVRSRDRSGAPDRRRGRLRRLHADLPGSGAHHQPAHGHGTAGRAASSARPRRSARAVRRGAVRH
jgi:tRNA-2-methylthio-N6-dimethylallyladenosine synthase